MHWCMACAAALTFLLDVHDGLDDCVAGDVISGRVPSEVFDANIALCIYRLPKRCLTQAVLYHLHRQRAS